MQMKNKLLRALVAILMVICVLVGLISRSYNNDAFINETLEALTEEEISFGRLGTEVRVCGMPVIEWNGIQTTCYHTVIRCNYWNGDGCPETLPCPIHGS